MKTISIASAISSRIDELSYMDLGFDIDDDFIGKKVSITHLGIRLDKVEPSEVYSIWDLLDASLPGFKPKHDGYSFYEFLTCSCGHAGCAGYYDGIYIHPKKKTIKITGHRRMGYKKGVFGTGPQVVYLDHQELTAIREEYLELFRKNPGNVFQINTYFFTGAYGLSRWGK